jgi:hypothetical protein
MEKRFSTDLIEHLIDYNFLFIKTKLDEKKYNRTIKKQIEFITKTKKESVKILEIDQLVKNLKQLIRTFQFLKQNKRHNIHLDVSDIYIEKIIKMFLNRNKKVLDKINLKNIYKEKALKNTLNCIIRLNTKSVTEKLLNKNYYLIHDINSTINRNNFGTYKIFNNLNEWKKLIFFFMIIKKNYKKKNI